ncbi:hypothetical protein [Laspinema palackyanum]|uniref:hypothetical protein n=1 Tax=Laspinema palackyanum TaxID=3231601 RepID=UPI00345DC6A9|nr:hypothetical protein [Laspinema sp. D2c]
MLEGLESQPESIRKPLVEWLKKRPEVRKRVIEFAEKKNAADPLPNRENVNSPRRKLSSEAEILQNLFELRKQAQAQQNASKNLPPQTH